MNWSCWMISYLNEWQSQSKILCMPVEHYKEKLFENGKKYAKSDNTLQNSINERIQNHILHVKFERKISVSQSNSLYSNSLYP